MFSSELLNHTGSEKQLDLITLWISIHVYYLLTKKQRGHAFVHASKIQHHSCMMNVCSSHLLSFSCLLASENTSLQSQQMYCWCVLRNHQPSTNPQCEKSTSELYNASLKGCLKRKTATGPFFGNHRHWYLRSVLVRNYRLLHHWIKNIVIYIYIHIIYNKKTPAANPFRTDLTTTIEPWTWTLPAIQPKLNSRPPSNGSVCRVSIGRYNIFISNNTKTRRINHSWWAWQFMPSRTSTRRRGTCSGQTLGTGTRHY